MASDFDESGLDIIFTWLRVGQIHFEGYDAHKPALDLEIPAPEIEITGRDIHKTRHRLGEDLAFMYRGYGDSMGRLGDSHLNALVIEENAFDIEKNAFDIEKNAFDVVLKTPLTLSYMLVA